MRRTDGALATDEDSGKFYAFWQTEMKREKEEDGLSRQPEREGLERMEMGTGDSKFLMTVGRL
jgi:hypothetical protein